MARRCQEQNRQDWPPIPVGPARARTPSIISMHTSSSLNPTSVSAWIRHPRHPPPASGRLPWVGRRTFLTERRHCGYPMNREPSALAVSRLGAGPGSTSSNARQLGGRSWRVGIVRASFAAAGQRRASKHGRRTRFGPEATPVTLPTAVQHSNNSRTPHQLRCQCPGVLVEPSTRATVRTWSDSSAGICSSHRQDERQRKPHFSSSPTGRRGNLITTPAPEPGSVWAPRRRRARRVPGSYLVQYRELHVPDEILLFVHLLSSTVAFTGSLC